VLAPTDRADSIDRSHREVAVTDAPREERLRYWLLGARNLRFEGYYATHDLVELPHATALREPNALRAMLGEKRYWLERERVDRE
jgi:hypothetical protein